MFLHLPSRERTIYALLVSVFLFGAGYVGAQRLRPTPKIEINIPADSKKSPFGLPAEKIGPRVVSTPATSQEVVVDVVGAVKTPGVQHLPAGSRVDDAVKAAGGAKADADLDQVNLAAKLEDGQQVSIPRKGEAASAPPMVGKPSVGRSKSSGKHPDKPINLNSSSYAELEELPGVGPAMAEKLMEYRLKNHHLSFADLSSIPGLGPKKLEKIRPWVKG